MFPLAFSCNAMRIAKFHCSFNIIAQQHRFEWMNESLSLARAAIACNLLPPTFIMGRDQVEFMALSLSRNAMEGFELE